MRKKNGRRLTAAGYPFAETPTFSRPDAGRIVGQEIARATDRVIGIRNGFARRPGIRILRGVSPAATTTIAEAGIVGPFLASMFDVGESAGQRAGVSAFAGPTIVTRVVAGLAVLGRWAQLPPMHAVGRGPYCVIQPVSPAKTTTASTEYIARFMSEDSLFWLVQGGTMLVREPAAAFNRHRPDIPQSPENRQNRCFRHTCNDATARFFAACNRTGKLPRVCGLIVVAARNDPDG